jgi:7-cyano-7-deazaguanine reductase
MSVALAKKILTGPKKQTNFIKIETLLLAGTSMSNIANLAQTDTHPLQDEAGTDGLKYGERAIAAGDLITFPNPRPGRRYHIRISLPEFTCKCPFSGYPDFATILIDYVPDQFVVELKALKLYINSYRDRYISHEESVNQILDDFVAACQPLDINVKGDFSPRGNVHTVIDVDWKKEC